MLGYKMSAAVLLKSLFNFRKLELRRIRKSPRFTNLYTNLLGHRLEILDGLSFFFSYKEIFEQELYAFRADTDVPVIIDAGANIGLSLIYAKQLYPKSHIKAFEADPRVFVTLKRNVENFALENVQLFNQAVWKEEIKLTFSSTGSDDGHIVKDFEQSSSLPHTFQVDAIRLRDFLLEPVDFLKIDIEGAETVVLKDCSEALKNVKNIFVEYHSFLSEINQSVDEILGLLKASGFRLQIYSPFTNPKPLLQPPSHSQMDIQLNIFGYRVDL